MTVNQKKIKKSEDNYQESQENEEDQRKASKLIAYLSTEMCTFVNVTCNASSNSQIGMIENPVVCGIKLIKTVPNYIVMSSKVSQRLCQSSITFNPVVIKYHKVLDKLTMVS